MYVLLSLHLYLILTLRLRSILLRVDKDIFNPRNLLPQQLIFLRQIIVLNRLKLEPFLIIMADSLHLLLMQLLLLLPCPLHISLDLLELTLHQLATALILLLQTRILISSLL